VGVNAATPIGISTFGYDTNGGGLYFDRDGGGTGTTYELFAQLSPVPAAANAPNAGSIQIIA
jgi:hypothetical protein